MARDNRTISCPHCGESIKRDAAACPYCGSDEKTGWSTDTYLDGVDLPDDIDYEDLRAREFNGSSGRKPQQSWMVITAIIVLAAFVAGILILMR
ncbi:MAG: zinc-ribbon domain-containing protein [Chitinispirillaceae bacterium]|nr:zinc-ribbon domain-containing protein [Chitinispirillaceae bacterium]